MSFSADDVVFFFGAGASAPFGIPTMKQMVADFEEHLKKNGIEDEIEVYGDIKKTLEVIIGKSVDLEAVFTVIDGIINYGVERLGLLSIYASAVSFAKILTEVPPQKEIINTCKSLRTKFQNFVREKCLIPEESFETISKVYQDLFNRFWHESSSRNSSFLRRGDYFYCTRWSIFTTNYDTCLEHYFRQVVRAKLNTGFSVDEARRTWVLNPSKFNEESLRLLKLHGSISWQIEPDETVTEEERVLGRSLVGREFVGEMMIYPVQEKELYLEPYISMFKLLNHELKLKSIWVIIGYSFNDPVIREIFLRNSDERKQIVLVHSYAQKVKEQRLNEIKCKRFDLLNQDFGEDNFREVNYSIIKCVKMREPEYPPEKMPV